MLILHLPELAHPGLLQWHSSRQRHCQYLLQQYLKIIYIISLLLYIFLAPLLFEALSLRHR